MNLGRSAITSIALKSYVAGSFGQKSVKTKINLDTPASYEEIQSGTSAYAFSVLLGKPSKFFLLNQQEELGDFKYKGGTSMSNKRELPWSYTEFDTYSQNTRLCPQDYNKLVSYKIFKDTQKVDDWMTWLQTDGINRIFNLYSNKKGSSSYNKGIIRLEDLELMFKNAAMSHPPLQQLIPALISYLQDYFPGKRGTGKYTKDQLAVYNKIEDYLNKGSFLTTSTKKQVGRSSTDSGHSGGEPMFRGLVGSHSYTIMGCEYDSKSGLYYVKLRNPWGYYGRDYDMKATKSSGGQARENNKDNTEFKLELSDFAKRFMKYDVSTPS